MGIREARKYITELHKKQADPLQWPDFVTGLPDSGAVLREIEKTSLGRNALVYFRIGNVEPYLAKYGTGRHSEIIEWAAAIIKASADKYDGFVGTVGMHEFLSICRSSACEDFASEVGKLFAKQALEFYKKADIKKGSVLSFSPKKGQKVEFGLMGLDYCVADRDMKGPRSEFITRLRQHCA